MLNPLALDGRTILLTGASSGIGRETARLLDGLGARLVLVARSPERLAETAAELAEAHRVEPFDLQETAAIPHWLKTVAEETGPLHGVVHCAGVRRDMPLRLLQGEHVDETMRINVTAAAVLARAYRQRGVAATGGSLVLLASVMGLVGESMLAAYSASKGAVIALTKSLAVELARDGIRVNCVAPGAVRSEMMAKVEAALSPEQFAEIERMHLLGLGEPRDVAHAIAFLLADTGRWITGTTLVVDGGYTAR